MNILKLKSNTPSDLVEYRFEKTQALDVSGHWNLQDDKLFLYGVTIVYQGDRQFECVTGGLGF